MNNTNLYDFSFVDRIESSNKLKYLLNKTTKLPLIVGKHGVGKTFFIENFFKKQSELKCIHITFDAEVKEHNGIEELLSALSKVKKASFLDYFNINYTAVFRIIGNNIMEKHFDNLPLLCNILGNAITVRAKDGNEKSVAEILFDYLLYLYSQEKIIIAFDNFHLCDKISLNKLIPLIKKSLEKDCNFRFIISITLTEDQVVKYMLEESIPREEIEILEFNDFLFFYEILFDILNISDKDKGLVSEIYEYCGGNPQQLLNLIHKLDAAKAIIYSDKQKRADINYTETKKILSDETAYIPLSEFTIQQHFIIYVIIEFGVLVPTNLLKDIVKYVMSKTAFALQIDEKTFFPEVLDLYSKGIITSESINNIKYVKMEHDSKLNYYKKEIDGTPFFDSINLYLFEYISQHRDNFLLLDNIDFLLSFHSYKGNVTNWQTLNFNYGKELYDHKDYINAAKIFSRLTDFLYIFTVSEKLIFIESFYNSGEYASARSIIKEIKENELEKENIYPFLYLKAKIYKFCLYQNEAEKTIEQIMQLENLSEEEYLNALSLEERVFANSSSNRQRAFEAYEKIKTEFNGNIKVESIYGSCLKTSVEFYRGKIAQNDLNSSIKIAEKHNDQYELGAIYTNKGFDLFWQGEIGEALNTFKKAYNILINVAEYEVSYPLNNIANCYIMMGDYENAIHNLKAALYWNKSDYVKITLRTLLAYCLAVTDEDFDVKADENFIYILNNLNSSEFSDISIKIKVNYLIGCIYEITGYSMFANKYKEEAYKLAADHNPKYLPYIWMLEYDEEITLDIRKRLPRHKFNEFYTHPFDPWLVTLSHD